MAQPETALSNQELIKLAVAKGHLPVALQKAVELGSTAVRSHKRAEKAHRIAARDTAEFVASMAELGIKVEFTDEGGIALDGTAGEGSEGEGRGRAEEAEPPGGSV